MRAMLLFIIGLLIGSLEEIEEFDAFVAELEAMGLREWEEIYQNAYNNYHGI